MTLWTYTTPWDVTVGRDPRSAEDFQSVGEQLQGTPNALITVGERFSHTLAQDAHPAVAGAAERVRVKCRVVPGRYRSGFGSHRQGGAVERQGMSRNDDSDGLRSW